MKGKIDALEKEIQLHNENSKKVLNLSEVFVSKLMSIFYCEIQRQNEDMSIVKSDTVIRKEQLECFIMYDQNEYIDAFNCILFNQILR